MPHQYQNYGEGSERIKSGNIVHKKNFRINQIYTNLEFKIKCDLLSVSGSKITVKIVDNKMGDYSYSVSFKK